MINLPKNIFFNHQIKKIIKTYLFRDKVMPIDDYKNNIYHPRNPLGFLFHEHNRLILVKALNKLDINLKTSTILDIGCGYGYWLRYLIELGANAKQLLGIDISINRLECAEKYNSLVKYCVYNGYKIPFLSNKFDLTIQVFVFSSIHNLKIRESLASEIFRVTKPGGYILWLDLKSNYSSNLIGFPKSRVVNLFPQAKIVYYDSVYPNYFRSIPIKYSWLSKLIYNFTHLNCDSTFIIFKKV